MNVIPEHEEVGVTTSTPATSTTTTSRLPPPPPPPLADYGGSGSGGTYIGGRKPGNWREQLRPPEESPLGSTSPTSSASTGSKTAGGGDGSEDGYESDWEKEISKEGKVFYVAPFSEEELRQERKERATEMGKSAAAQSVAKAAEERKNKKGTGKLSRLVRRRESKRERSVIVAKAGSTAAGVKGAGTGGARVQLRTPLQSPGVGGGESSDNDSSTYYGQLKTFESVFEGTSPIAEMQEVTMRIKGRKNVADNRASLIEQMMGIVPVRHHHRQDVDHRQDMDPVVVVAGFLTDGPAIKISDKLQIGDIIRLVDGQQVNLTIIEQLLSTYSSSTKIKITIQRPPAKMFPDPLSLSHDDSGSTSADMAPSLVKMLTGDGPTSLEVQSMLKRLPYIVLYLTRSGITESSPELADVLYQYPTAASGHHSIKLLKVRGMFVTLCQALPEITGGSVPLTSTVIIDHELVHVGYAEEGEDVLLVALPDGKCNAGDVGHIVCDMARVLRLQYGSLAAAFSTRNHVDLNKMLNILLLDELLNICSSQSRIPPPFDIATILSRNPPKFDERLHATHWLNLPDDIKFQVDDAMNQFESGDFQDYSEDFYDFPREFNILGSCVFYKGLLLASHLPKDDLIDVVLWSKLNKLLRLTRESPVHQLVAWSEIYLTRRSNRSAEQERSEYAEVEGRTFLLVVGLGYQLLGSILQTGGCAARPKGKIRPDPFYVDQAMNTLDHLDEMGIPVVCDCWLRLPANPDLVNVDNLYEAGVNAKKLDASVLSNASASARQLPEKGIILQRTKSIDYSSASSPTESDEVSLHQSETSEVSEEAQQQDGKTQEVDESNSSVWELRRSGQRARTNYSETARSDRPRSPSGAAEYVTYQVSQLSISPENTIFHYVDLDGSEGVILSPLSPPTSVLHTELLDNFRAACQIMHANFESFMRASKADFARGDDKRSWVCRSAPTALFEQGSLFQWSPRAGEKNLPTLSYWVSARLFPGPRECYVCYHESAPQNMVELAYRLTHGVHL